MGSPTNGHMTLYETLLNMLGVLVDRTIELFPKPKEDFQKVQRILKASADEFTLRCEEDLHSGRAFSKKCAQTSQLDSQFVKARIGLGISILRPDHFVFPAGMRMVACSQRTERFRVPCRGFCVCKTVRGKNIS